MDATSPEFDEQVSAMALTILHEYTHFGDRYNNEGNVTGQNNVEEGRAKFDSDNGVAFTSKIGTQAQHASVTGHRGTDLEVLGFNVRIDSGPPLDPTSKADPYKLNVTYDPAPTGIAVEKCSGDEAPGDF